MLSGGGFLLLGLLEELLELQTGPLLVMDAVVELRTTSTLY